MKYQIDAKVKQTKTGTYKTGENVGQAYFRVVLVEEGMTHDLVVSGADYQLCKVGTRVVVSGDMMQKVLPGRAGTTFTDTVYTVLGANVVAVDGKAVERSPKG